MKRIISLLLSMALLVSAVPPQALADELQLPDPAAQTEAAEIVGEAGEGTLAPIEATAAPTETTGASTAPTAVPTAPTEPPVQQEPPSEILAEGQCGDAVYWSVDSKGVLLISGKGEMDTYNYWDLWQDYDASIRSVVVNEGVTFVYLGVSQLPNLTSLTLSASVDSIGYYGIQGFKNLKNVSVAEDSKTFCVRNGILYSKDMTTLYLYPAKKEGSVFHVPANVIWIREGAFDGNPYLTEVYVSDSVQTVGDAAFSSCTALKKAVIPESVTSVGNGVFGYCAALESVTMPFASMTSGNYYYRFGYFFGQGKYEGSIAVSQDYSNSYTDQRTYYVPAGLKHITVGGISVISGAFEDFSMVEHITLTESVTHLNPTYDPFWNCSSLKILEFCGDPPAMKYNLFEGKSLTAYYPKGNTAWNASVVQNYGGSVTWKEKECVGITHVGTPVQEKKNPPTCETPGSYDEVLYCKVCGVEASRKTVVLEATGHSPVTDPGREATCTETGLTEGSHCDVCEKVLQEQAVIPCHHYEDGYCTDCGTQQPMDSGSCGDSLSWELYDGGRLEIIGSGEMWDYSGDDMPGWYDYRDQITEVVLPEGLTGIGKLAFSECSAFTQITLPSTLTQLGYAAFAECESLERIEIPAGVTVLPEMCFYKCYALKEIILPDTLTEIKRLAFYICTALETVTLPESITTICDNAFNYCTWLTEMTIPASVQTMGEEVFVSCSSLNSVTFLGDAPAFGGNLFSIKNRTIYYSVHTQGWTEAVRAKFDSSTNWVPLECKDGHTIVVIPGKEATCTAMGRTEGAYCSVCGEVTQIQHDIGFAHTYSGSVCVDCGALKPTASGTCGENLFWELRSGTMYIYGSGEMTDYWNNLPWANYVDSITEVVIGQGVTSIGDTAFYESAVERVCIPDSVTRIGGLAFYGCDELYYVDLGAGLQELDLQAFAYCSNLEMVAFPEGLLTIGNYAFQSCKKLMNVTIPNSVRTIGDYAFGNCNYLRYVTVGSGVTALGDMAFQGCVNLKQVKFLGDAPTAGGQIFTLTGPIGYYPAGNATWTSSARSAIGGMYVTWQSYAAGDTSPVGCTGNHVKRIDEPAVEPTCQEPGKTALTHCALCGLVLSRPTVIPVKPHDPVIDAAVEPTCTENGLTEGSHCSVCGVVLAAQVAVPFRHDYADGSCTLCGVKQPLAEGICGEDLIWRLEEDGVLTISGTGAMGNFYDDTVADETFTPWKAYTEQIRHVVMEEGVTNIEEYTFYEYPNLETVSIPETVTQIGRSAFGWSPRLAKIVIPGSVTEIGNFAFLECTGLTDVVFQGSAPEMGINVFLNVTAQILYPYKDDSWLDVVDNQYGGVLTWVMDVPRAGKNANWEFDEETGILRIFGTGAMTDFEEYYDTPWYDSLGKIKKLVVEEGITSVGANSFVGATGLTEVVLADSVTQIGMLAFDGCRNLYRLSMPVSARVEECAFSYCTDLIEITLTPGTGAMCDYTESTSEQLPWKQTTLVKVEIEEGVTHIGDYAFYDASSVLSVQLPKTLKTIGQYAFAESWIGELDIPEGVTEIGSYALSGMGFLKNLVLPESLTTLGSYALSDSGVQAVQFGGGLRQLPEGAFEGCDQLATVKLPEGLTSIGARAFYDCMELWGIALPSGVRAIGEYAFWNCRLNSLELPRDLDEVGAFAFAMNKKLTRVVVGSNTDTIGSYAFAYCDNLVSLVVHASIMRIDSYAFYRCDALKEVYYGTYWGWGMPYPDDPGVYIVSTGNSCLFSAKLCNSGDYNAVREVHILDPEDVFGLGGDYLDGQILTVDLNQVEALRLRHQVVPQYANSQEITWTSDSWDLVQPKVERNGDLLLKNMKPGEMTVYARNFNREMIEYLGYDPYTYATASIHLVFRRPVTQITISGDHDGYAALNTPLALTAKVMPQNAENTAVRWCVEAITGAATISGAGVLTGTRSGTVLVRAEAADGSGVAAEKVIEITPYAVEVTGPDEVAGGKSITLKAAFRPFNMTDTKLQWRLKDPADSEFVTLKNGKVTAKKVKQRHSVTILAESADGMAAAAEKTILVVPITAEVAISREEMPVTGQTVLYDLNDPELTQLSFRAQTLPGDAADEIQWIWSDTKNTYAQYGAAGEGITVSGAAGKTGTVTLTAKAMDGSNKKAVVKVKFVRLAQSVEILEAPTQLRGGSKLNLKTSVALDKTLTDKNILWSLTDESVPFASISAKGVLTTRAVAVPVTITVVAQVKANPEKQTEIRIQLLPAAVQPQICVNGIPKGKGETVYVDMSSPKVSLSGSILPMDAMQQGKWKLSGKAGTLTENADGTASVTMNKPGTVTVTFTAADGSKKNTSVKLQAVLPVKTIGLYAPKGETELRSGKTLQLKTSPYTAQAGVAPSVKKFIWSVSDPTAATVSASGKVKALTVYRNTPVTITAEALDGSGVKESYQLLIKPAKEKTLLIRHGEENITGTTRYFDAVFDGVSALPSETLSVWVYDSEMDQLTQVEAAIAVSGKALHLAQDGYTVSPKAYGGGTVTAKYEKLSAKVSYQAARYVQGIAVSSKTGADWVLAGKSLNLKAEVTNADATNRKLLWSVSDPDAATISKSGVLKAKKVTFRTEVTVTATATDGSGVAGTRQITIYPAASSVIVKDAGTGRIMNNRTITVSLEEQAALNLKAVVYPAGTYGALDAVTFSGSGKAAQVSPDGVVTFRNKGTVTVKATAADGSKVSASFKITVQ